MEENSLSTPQEKEFDENLCVNCQINSYEPGHNVNLCSSCRKDLINYPIPKWIKIFAIVLAGLIIVSIIRIQTYVSAAIDLGKGEKAIERREYVTAQREFAKVLNKFPDDITANANMIIAASYNFDGNAINISSNRIANKKIDDEELLASANAAIDYASSMFSTDTVTIKKIDSVSKEKAKLIKLYDELKQRDVQNSIKVHIASYLFDLKDFIEAETILNELLKESPNDYSALSLMSAVKRDSKKFDEAITVVNKLLAINREDVYAISQKTRIELKRKHDQQAAIYANQAMKIDPQNDSSLEAKAMVDFFAGRKKECMTSLSIINAHLALTGDSTISKRLTNIINGSQIYR